MAAASPSQSSSLVNSVPPPVSAVAVPLASAAPPMTALPALSPPDSSAPASNPSSPVLPSETSSPPPSAKPPAPSPRHAANPPSSPATTRPPPSPVSSVPLPPKPSLNPPPPPSQPASNPSTNSPPPPTQVPVTRQASPPPAPPVSKPPKTSPSPPSSNPPTDSPPPLSPPLPELTPSPPGSPPSPVNTPPRSLLAPPPPILSPPESSADPNSTSDANSARQTGSGVATETAEVIGVGVSVVLLSIIVFSAWCFKKRQKTVARLNGDYAVSSPFSSSPTSGKDRPAFKVAAHGLAYLHEGCHPRIIHRDIKSSNILPDDSFEALVSDFGLAKLALDSNTHMTTRVMGTFGYMALEYASSGKLTEKSDVFSFGVVLLELITGRKPVDQSQPFGDESLVEWVVRALDTLATSDLTNGMRLGDSEVYNSAEQDEAIRQFQRMAFGSHVYSSELFSLSSAPTS